MSQKRREGEIAGDYDLPVREILDSGVGLRYARNR